MVLNANSNPAYFAMQAFLGTADQSHDTAIDFESGSSQTGAAISKTTVVVAGNSTVAVNVADKFANCPSPQFFCAFDETTTPGQNFGISFTGAPFAMVAPSSFWGYACDGSALPSTLYLFNPNATAGTIILACITN